MIDKNQILKGLGYNLNANTPNEPSSEIANTINSNTDSISNTLFNLNEKYYRTRGLNIGGNQSLITKGFNFYREDYTLVNKEFYGYTFFTRPKLNLATPNLFNHRLFSFLNTEDPNSVGFAIRCFLDPIYSQQSVLKGLASKSSLFDPMNPFIPILTNRIKSMSGFPDWVMEVETSEGGFFSEDITMAKGWNNLAKTYDLTTVFRDVRGGFILALFLFWFLWIDCAVKGVVRAYSKYIEERKICYTISIYRFLVDETNSYITKWGKSTGAFPVSVPIGAFFNFNNEQPYVLENANLSIPFKICGKQEYLDPVILLEFNTLVKRYCPTIESFKNIDITNWYRYNGKIIPYIDLKKGTNRLLWKGNPNV